MNIRELSFDEFHTFVSNHPLGNFYQSLEYALLKAEEGYDYEFIGYTDNHNILAASLILYKKEGNYYYGYAPRGFLVDYNSLYFLKEFTSQIKDYYKKRGFASIRINPEIAIGQLVKGEIEHNANFSFKDNLLQAGYKKLDDDMHFDYLLPRMNAIVSLDSFSLETLSKNTRNKVKKGLRKGLTLVKADVNKMDILYNFIKNKDNKDLFYYKDFYNAFNKNDSVDLFLVKVDFKKYLLNTQEYYNRELFTNNLLNNKIVDKNNTTNINAKMSSDKTLLVYKNEIAEASKHLNNDEELYIAGAMVIVYKNRITIKISGFDKDYKSFSPNYYLYYAILDYYKDNYNYADLNGITADMSENNPYHGLNRFKLGFNPKIYEYIGEYELTINNNAFTNSPKKSIFSFIKK